jgi:hypothetical protein
MGTGPLHVPMLSTLSEPLVGFEQTWFPALIKAVLCPSP